VLLTETHRIEVAGHRPDAAPEKPANTGEARSGLDTVATRLDHIVIAVDDVESAKSTLRDRFGFHEVAMAGAARPGICTLAVGGVTFVLVGPQASPSVAAYLETHGQGVQHIAVEVLNAGFARACLADAGTPLLTEVLVDQDGHEQFFAVSEPAAGIQLGFISRTGHRVGVGAENVLALFDAIRTTAS
jgi:4-hydroxyphenylpyruvate dioxygenase-like putative hemolysin